MTGEPFELSTTNDKFYLKRAVLGNGYFGIDASNNFGQGFGISESKDPFPTTYLGGVYSNAIEKGNPDKLDSIFRPLNTFSLIPASQSVSDDYSVMNNYSQTLDMKKATVFTFGTWGNYNIESKMYLCRHLPHMGVLQLKCSIVDHEADGNSPIEFIHLVRKDPRVKYLEIRSEIEDQPFLEIYNTKIEEDGYKFNKKSEFNIVQISAIEIFDKAGNNIPFTTTTSSFNDEDLGFDGELKYETSLNLNSNSTASANEKLQEFTLTLYFGIFKENDPEIENDLEKYAKDYILAAMAMGEADIYQNHNKSWENEVWDRLIEVSDTKIQQLIIASMYQMACTFKEGIPNSSGPTGLNNFAWEGHVFWDSDLWMNLGLLLWAPELSRSITEFRFNCLKGALQHRINYVEECEYENITEGIKFPWQSTTSGLECAPPGWSAQEHITCDVIYGQFLYYTATGDENYLKNIAFPIVFDAATYLGQRVEKGADGKYHFRGVVPADEFPFPNIVDDNAFTNLYVDKCIKIVTNWAKKLDKSYPKVWDEIVDNMFYNFDNENQRIIEFTGYTGQKIKQADTNLLTFPLEYPFSPEIKRNNMVYYFDKLPNNKIMMGSAIFSIIACELNDKEKAWEYFQDLFPHFHEDNFLLASESPINTCWPFLTGLGGFLANIIYGFGGCRLRDDGILIDPKLPKQISPLAFNSLSFQGKRIKLVITDNKSFSITGLGDIFEIKLYFRENSKYLPENKNHTLIEMDSITKEINYKIKIEKDETVKFSLS
jgi:trehalose/maltose hydrolase-like predicted phosphorylase